MVIGLENFRDLDYHFVSPLVIKSGEQLELQGDCTSPDCTPGVYYIGFYT